MKKLIVLIVALLLSLSFFSVALAQQEQDTLKGALGEELLQKAALPESGEDSTPYLAMYVEYERTDEYCTTHAKATLLYVNSNGKSDNPAAKDLTIEIKTEDTLQLLEGADYHVFYEELPCGGKYTFEFDLFCEFPMEEVEKVPEPKLTIKAKSSNVGGCEYTCTFDSMTEARALIWGWNTGGDTPMAIRNDLKMMDRLFSCSYYNMQPVEVPAPVFNHENIWELISQLPSLQTDENDVTYIYLNAHGATIGKDQRTVPGFFANAPGTSVFVDDKEYKDLDIVLYNQLFPAIQQRLKGRVVFVLDVCYSGMAISRAENAGFEEGELSLLTAIDGSNPAGATEGWFENGYGWFTKELYNEFINREGIQTIGDAYEFMSEYADEHFTLWRMNPQFTGNSDTALFCDDEDAWIEDPEFVVVNETLAAASMPGSVVVTTETYEESGKHFKSNIVRPRVYADANPQLTAIVDAQMDKLYLDKLASVESSKANAAACKYGTRDHTETLKLTAAYSSGGFVVLTLQNGYFDCAVGHNVSETLVYCFDVATGELITMEDMLDTENNPNAKDDLIRLMGEKLKEAGASASDAQKVYSEAVKNRYVYWDITPKGFSFSIDRMNTGIKCGGFTVYFDQMEGILKKEYLPQKASGQAGFSIGEYDVEKASTVYGNLPAVNVIELSGTAQHVWITDSYGSNPLDGRCAHFYAYCPTDALITLSEPQIAEYGYAVAWIDADGEHVEHLNN